MSSKIHQWVTLGERWECDAYDHGPFCRQCRKVENWSTKPIPQENVEEPT